MHGRTWIRAALVAAAAGFVVASSARQVARQTPAEGAADAAANPRAVPELAVPAIPALPKLDGELDDAIWHLPVARTGPFTNERGEPARPYSDARIAWAREHLVLALYAGDEDIRTRGAAEDLFRVTLGRATFAATASGELRGAPEGTRAGRDVDGTPDAPADDDEEWVLELAVPLRSLGLDGRAGERLAFAAERCDTTHDGVRRCAATRADLVLNAAR